MSFAKVNPYQESTFIDATGNIFQLCRIAEKFRKIIIIANK